MFLPIRLARPDPVPPTLAPGPLLAEAVQPAEGSGGAGLRWPRRPDAGADLPLVDVANAVTAAARGLGAVVYGRARDQGRPVVAGPRPRAARPT